MSRITLDLIRKRSEHNEGEISTLEEIALHQENLERIELIDKTCKNLTILLLQNNLVSRIENLSKLKKLEYLNLALNNIELIENLEGLESLKKLDLTVNFIGDLRTVDKLRCNEKLEQLFLMGNPCADYHHYREYTIATLPQLKQLDGMEIERSERIKALQIYPRVEGEILRSCARYRKQREAEILDRDRERTTSNEEPVKQAEEEDENEKFWKQSSRHTPEERVAIAERFLRKREQNNREDETRASYTPKLFSSDGKPYNVNQAKVSFKLNDHEYPDRIVLEVAVYKYLDTLYIDADVQSDYVRVTIKGKVLQLTLSCQVSIEGSTAERNTVNGNLIVTMPRLSPLPVVIGKSKPPSTARLESKKGSLGTVREYLEIGPVTHEKLDFSKIVISRTGERARAKEQVIPKEKESLKEMRSWENVHVPLLE